MRSRSGPVAPSDGDRFCWERFTSKSSSRRSTTHQSAIMLTTSTRLDAPDAAADVAAALGHNRADALAAMQDIAVKQRVIAANDAAVARGVFGSPFFFVDD
jgi:hypothetical protein